ncbi:MAG: hypothetical protein QNJ63_08955 [Calothrix sp. MO_192.B10]|nr:hypothetical protein [Calothrix sp. MO_192.B10]
MKQWVIQKNLQTDEEWLKQKEKVFITLISRQGFDSFKKTIKWLWANPEEVSKAIKVTWSIVAKSEPL